MKLNNLLASTALAFATVMAAASAANAVAITPAVEYTSTGSLSDSRPFTLGYSFSLSSPVTVNALGYDEIGFASNEQVGIWDSTGGLITSTTVLTTDPQVGHFYWDAISPVTLGAGTYTIGGTYDGGPFQSYASGVTTIPGYTWITDEQVYGAGLNFPNYSTGGGYGQNGILQVDFSVTGGGVPEPATWAMMLVGLGGMGAAMRMSRRTRGAAAVA